MAKKKKKEADVSSVFTWEGKTRDGRVVKGKKTAANPDEVKKQLLKLGITPITGKIKKQKKPRGRKITPSDIAIFARQLATMMKAGVPMVQAFEIVGSGSANSTMAELLFKIKASIEAGGTLASALAEHPLIFDDLFISLIDAGEQSGALEDLLEKIATYKEKSEALRVKIKSAMTYPIGVLIVACIVSAILLIFVVPTFSAMFAGFGAELPAFTQMVVEMSEFMTAYWYIIIGVGYGIGKGFSEAKLRSKKFRDNLDKLYLKIPGVGDLIVNSAIARFARTLSTMFAAGVPLVDAMDNVARAAGNSVYVKAISRIKDDIATGGTLQGSLAQDESLFPNMLVQMVGIGEESGALDEMLAKVADYYESAVDESVDNLTAMMEPLIMSFLAVMIGGLVIAMYLPVFKMGEVVTGSG